MRRALLQRHAPGPIPEDLPTSLKRLLRQCFHETPDERPSLSQIKQVCMVLSAAVASMLKTLQEDTWPASSSSILDSIFMHMARMLRNPAM